MREQIRLKTRPDGIAPLSDHTTRRPAFASCPRGLEAALQAELAGLGATDCKAAQGGIEFEATWPDLMRINLWSRLAGRVLMRLRHAPCNSDTELYQLVKAVDWNRWFKASQTLRVDLNNLGVTLPNARFLQLRVKDAVCDFFLETAGKRPSIDLDNPDAHVVVAIGATYTSIYIDLSGENLFKRGWRQEKGSAPLKENLAAGLLVLTQWESSLPLLDPFCGSGTILIEAACMATDRAPGLNRRFAFENLTGFQAAPWAALKAEAVKRFDAGLRACPDLQLRGSDITRMLVELAEHNSRLADLGPLLEDGRLRFEQRDARTIEAHASAGLILTNPPYGERLQAKGSSAVEDEAYAALFQDLGSRLKQGFAGWRFCCLTADLEVRRVLGLSPKRRTPLMNGGLDCRLFEFPMAAGQYRKPEQSSGA